MKNRLLLSCAVACLLALPIAAPAQDSNGGNGQSQSSRSQSPRAQSGQPTPKGLPSLADQTPPATPPGPLSVEQAQALCRAQWKAYLNSLACFAPFRHSAHVLDIEAFKHCRVVKEPDCARQ